MSTTEEPVAESIASSIHGAAAEGAEIVGVDPNADATTKIEAINNFLTPKKAGWFGKKTDPNVDNWTDRSLPIGCLWGETMVQHFGWTWANLIQHDHDDFKAIAVVNDDRSLAIFPWHYCFGCLENDVHPTVLLAFKMLGAEKIPKQDPRGFANLMDGVQHIVPPG